MPKRSNQFQKLVLYVAEQVAPIGATVRESAEIPEKGLHATATREVDVLIEADGGIAPVRIAIECRDRSRKDDIQWIDDLIGKYGNLEVNQVVAVSASGFSETAKQKAELNGILTLSLEEASETDWPDKFLKLGIAKIEQYLHIVSIKFITHPEFEGPPNARDTIYSRNTGADDDTNEYERIDVTSFVEKINPIVLEQIREYVDSNALTIYKSLSDFAKDALVERTLPVTDLLLVDQQGKEYQINEIVYKVLVRSQFSTIDVKRHLLTEKAMITSAILQHNEHANVSLSAVQVRDVAEGKLFFEQKPKAKKKPKSKHSKAQKGPGSIIVGSNE